MTLVLSIICESGGPSGTRILSLPQHDLRRETGPVSTCYMAAAKVVEEESGISRQCVVETNRASERSVCAHESPASRSALYNQPA